MAGVIAADDLCEGGVGQGDAVEILSRPPETVALLMQRVAEGSPDVDGLFRAGTFDAGRPSAVRATAWRYTFGAPGSAAVWVREPLGVYCPEVRRR